MKDLSFNSVPSTIMHIDLNSCFATIEQQANPLLRGKPIAVAAYTTPNGCILAPSVEAKRFGIKTGMRVKDGKLLYPGLIVLASDPEKYRNVHLSLRKLISSYTNDFSPKSIDEFVLNFKGLPAFSRGLITVGKEIKQRIKKEIGEWLTVSVGIAPNRFLAKTAAGLHKPDGLDEINQSNFLDCYLRLTLTDLCGIKFQNAMRLNNLGIFTAMDFYKAPLWKLKAAFESINGFYWYMRLRGWEIDDVNFARKSYGNSYALPKPFSTPGELSPILMKLTEKMSFRLRRAGFTAQGLHLAITYRDGNFWHKGITFPKDLFDAREIYKRAFKILLLSPYKNPVREIAVSVFDLRKMKDIQLEMFADIVKENTLVRALDKINQRWGSFVVHSARMLPALGDVPDRIAFGGIKELEEFTLT